MNAYTADRIVRRAIETGRARKLARRARETMVYSDGPAIVSRRIWAACCHRMQSSITDEIALSLPPVPLARELYEELMTAGR